MAQTGDSFYFHSLACNEMGQSGIVGSVSGASCVGPEGMYIKDEYKVLVTTKLLTFVSNYIDLFIACRRLGKDGGQVGAISDGSCSAGGKEGNK